ncbi:hypothetical protein GCM10010411_32290 [Actinomadura fulvescens]|uniref:Uncharacterized protein n=1 Tax=Actinomadura fulvescens TaxID=46160 RepID=A0ABP6C0J1_9ACTN
MARPDGRRTQEEREAHPEEEREDRKEPLVQRRLVQRAVHGQAGHGDDVHRQDAAEGQAAKSVDLTDPAGSTAGTLIGSTVAELVHPSPPPLVRGRPDPE